MTVLSKNDIELKITTKKFDYSAFRQLISKLRDQFYATSLPSVTVGNTENESYSFCFKEQIFILRWHYSEGISILLSEYNPETETERLKVATDLQKALSD